MTTVNSPKLSMSAQVGIVLVGYITAQTLLVIAAYLWVYIYSISIYTAGDQAYYDAYAQNSSPVVAVLLAGPLYFLLGRLLRKRWSAQALKLETATGILNLFVSVPVVFSAAVDNVGYHLSAALLATVAMIIGARIGAATPSQAQE